MKISLITFHCATSFGAALQTYALCRILTQAGHSVEIVDYRPTCLAAPPDWRKTRFYGFHPAHLEVWLTRHRFRVFQNRYFTLSPVTYRSRSELRRNPPEADAYVCGSDQIWNPQLTGGELDPAYFLDFAPPGKRRIAYAASLGGGHLPEIHLAQFQALLARMDFISCREREASEFVTQCTGAQSTTVLDPTLLLDDYGDIAPPAGSDIRRPYVFAFPVQINSEAFRAIAAAGRELNCPVRIVNGLWKFWAQPGHPSYPGPDGWLRLLQNAQAVVTNSFHATVFSILFQKNFIVLPLRGKTVKWNTRLVHLLETLGLQNRLIPPGDMDTLRRQLHCPIRWPEVATLLNSRRADSMQFLAAALHAPSPERNPP